MGKNAGYNVHMSARPKSEQADGCGRPAQAREANAFSPYLYSVFVLNEIAAVLVLVAAARSGKPALPEIERLEDGGRKTAAA